MTERVTIGRLLHQPTRSWQPQIQRRVPCGVLGLQPLSHTSPFPVVKSDDKSTIGVMPRPTLSSLPPPRWKKGAVIPTSPLEVKKASPQQPVTTIAPVVVMKPRGTKRPTLTLSEEAEMDENKRKKSRVFKEETKELPSGREEKKEEKQEEKKSESKEEKQSEGKKRLYCVYELPRPADWSRHQKALTLVPLDPHQFGRKHQRRMHWEQECKKMRLFGTRGSLVCVPPQYGLKHFGPPDEDLRPEGKDIDVECLAKLWGPDDPFDQGPVTERLRERFESGKTGGGVVELPTSSGKTLVLLNKICTIVKKKALWVTPSVPVHGQTIQTIREYAPGARIGVIHRDKREIENKDIVVAMLHTLVRGFQENKFRTSDFNDFGVVVYDEIHCYCTKTFKLAIVYLAHIRRMVGVSATVARPNGMDALLEPYLGPFIYRAPSASKDAHLVRVQRLDFSEGTQKIILNEKTEESDYGAMCEALHADEKRTEAILHLLDNILCVGRRVLVLVTRTDFGQKLVEECRERNPRKKCVYYAQDLKPHQRDTIRSTPHDLIVATYSICGLGVDITYLDTLLFATPCRNIKQPVGRLRSFSKFERQSLLVIDWVDTFSIFRTQAGHRRRIYAEKGYTCLPILPAHDVSFLYSTPPPPTALTSSSSFMTRKT